MQYGTVKIGQVIKLMVDAIGEDALMDSLSEKEKKSWHRKINRLINEKDIRIDTIREFGTLIDDCLEKFKNKGYIQQVHIGMIQTLYWNLLALVTETLPFSTPTSDEFEKQVMWCIADLFHECLEFQKTQENIPVNCMNTTLFSFFDYWKIDEYSKHVSLIHNSFNSLFNDLSNKYSKSDFFKIWDDKKQEIHKESGKYSKSVNDWLSKDKIPTWKMLKPIFESQLNSNDNADLVIYSLFKFQLFAACFMKRFIKSLYEQKLVRKGFIEEVQEGFLGFYRQMFVYQSFKTLTINLAYGNFMFICLRGLCVPNTKLPVSDLIREAFSKLDKRHPDWFILQNICYIDSELAIHPEYEKFSKIGSSFSSKEFWCISRRNIGKCSDFFLNWFKGRYLVLKNHVQDSLNFYRKAFENKYFAGQFTADFIREILAVMEKCDCKKTDKNEIVDFAHALKFCINRGNKQYEELNRIIDCSFDEVFPKESFFDTNISNESVIQL